MTFAEAYEAAKAVPANDDWLSDSANDVSAIDGVQADVELDDLSKKFNESFKNHKFTVMIELPGAANLGDNNNFAALSTRIGVWLVENPKKSRSDTDHSVVSLDALQKLAEAFVGQPGGKSKNNFKPSQKFMEFKQSKDGMIYYRLSFQITTHLKS
ncbi:hypothetical protein [Rubellicoccus peritrichatus]|uniref:Uncharacterized protein n=1 Tax=Rubellicoccus peritrichatus TaxID=3080537 RepID=A0AAQ3LJ72_9BACT|nr:hypothetical protein [Puniceicoccus sp. CR14]WOO43159.1 hypothetical protein RZN69_08640 [Puniceicoccus sp. CR14]